jgi:hypothetical protein
MKAARFTESQIVLEDQQKTLAVHLRNNGLVPFIIDKLTCNKSDVVYASLEECLALERRSYMWASINDSVRRVVLPSSSLTVFETRFDEHESEATMDRVRKQLAPITLKMEFYDNKMTS